MTRNLVVHYQRRTYLIVPNPVSLGFAGRRVCLSEAADGAVEIRCAGQLLPYTVLEKQPLVAPGAVVENKRLGAVLSMIRVGQEERDQRRLASKQLTLRQKARLRESRAETNRNTKKRPSPMDSAMTSAPNKDRLADALAAAPGSPGCGPEMANFFAKFEAEQKARRKRYNDASNQRKRDREQLESHARVKAAEPIANVVDVGPAMTVNSVATAPPACGPLEARC